MVELRLLGRGVAIGAGLALAWLTVRTVRHRQKPAARTFAALLGILAVTAVCAGVTVHTGVAYKLVWLYTGLSIPVALAFFAFDYYGSSLFATRSRARLALAPAVVGAVAGTVLIVATPLRTPEMAVGAPLPAVVVELAASLEDVGVYYTTALAVLAVGVVLRTVYRYDHLDSRLGPAVAVLGTWPWVANQFVPQLAASFSLDVAVATVAGGYATSAALAAVAVGPLGLLDSSPMAGNVGPEVVLDSIDDAVLVADDHGRVLRLNTVAAETFGTTEPAAAGGPVTAVLGHSLSALADGECVTIETADGPREFAVTRSTVTDRTGADRGTTLVLRDVTRRETREQRLDVFNRILRHNLRNDATSIMGYARLVADGGDPETYADRIVDTTEELVSVGERAREVDRILSAPPDGTADLATVVTAAVESVESTHPGVDVTSAVPDGTRIAAPPEVAEIVLRNLADNAARHNDADEPIVVVSADRDGERVRVAVRDNGPGIPDHERAVLEAGEEDPLEHGSSVGLWAVNWGVRRVGGSLSFAANDPRGSVVTVTLPTADTDAERKASDPA